MKIGDLEQDVELNVMSQTYQLLRNLKDGEQRRVINWLADRLHIGSKGGIAPSQTVVSRVEASTRAAKSTRDSGSRKAAAVVAEMPGDVEAIVTELTNYSIQGLFERVQTKTDVARVLLVAAYLQERGGADELGSRSINKELKSVGRGIKNITQAINSLLKKDPALLVMLRKTTKSQQGKKRCRVTELGMQKVKEALTTGVLKV